MRSRKPGTPACQIKGKEYPTDVHFSYAKHLPLIIFAVVTTILNLLLGGLLDLSVGEEWFVVTMIGTILGQIVFYFVIAGLYGASWLDGFLVSCLFVTIAVALFIATVIRENSANAYASLLVLPAAIAVGAGPLLLMRHFFGWRLIAEARPRLPSTLTNMFVGTLMVGALLMTIRGPEVIWEFEGSDYWMGAGIALTCLLLFGLVCAVPAAVAAFSQSSTFPMRVTGAAISWIIVAMAIVFGLTLSFGGNVDADFCMAIIGIWLLATTTVFSGLLAMRYAGYRLETGSNAVVEFEKSATKQFLRSYHRRTWIQVALVLGVSLAINAYVAKLIAKRMVIEQSIAKIDERVREMDGHVAHHRRMINSIELPTANDETLQTLLTDLKALHLSPSQLNLNESKITDASLEAIGDCDGIRNLSLANTRVTGHGFEHLNKLQLDEIDLSGLTLTDADWKLTRWNRLNTLRLANAKVASDSFASFLARSDIYTLMANGSDLDGETLKGISQLGHRSTQLNLADTNITDADYAQFHSDTISSLDLSATKITDESLRLIGTCTRLHSLNLRSTAITDAGLAHFKWTRQRMSMDLSNTKITGKGFEDWPLVYAHHLNVSDTLINDETVKMIVRDKAPGNLVLSGTQITDAALPVLLNAPQLSYLTIKRTAITAGGIVKNAPTGRSFTFVVEPNQFTAADVVRIEAGGNRLVVE